VQAQRRRAVARRELQGQDAHADEVAAVDPLVALGDDRLDAEQVRALRRPVARTAGAVLLARDGPEGDALGLVLRGRAEGRGVRAADVAVAEVAGRPARGAGRDLVVAAAVGERAAHHDVVRAAPGAVLAEVAGRDPVRL